MSHSIKTLAGVLVFVCSGITCAPSIPDDHPFSRTAPPDDLRLAEIIVRLDIKDDPGGALFKVKSDGTTIQGEHISNPDTDVPLGDTQVTVKLKPGVYEVEVTDPDKAFEATKESQEVSLDFGQRVVETFEMQRRYVDVTTYVTLPNGRPASGALVSLYEPPAKREGCAVEPADRGQPIVREWVDPEGFAKYKAPVWRRDEAPGCLVVKLSGHHTILRSGIKVGRLGGAVPPEPIKMEPFEATVRVLPVDLCGRLASDEPAPAFITGSMYCLEIELSEVSDAQWSPPARVSVTGEEQLPGRFFAITEGLVRLDEPPWCEGVWISGVSLPENDNSRLIRVIGCHRGHSGHVVDLSVRIKDVEGADDIEHTVAQFNVPLLARATEARPDRLDIRSGQVHQGRWHVRSDTVDVQAYYSRPLAEGTGTTTFSGWLLGWHWQSADGSDHTQVQYSELQADGSATVNGDREREVLRWAVIAPEERLRTPPTEEPAVEWRTTRIIIDAEPPAFTGIRLHDLDLCPFVDDRAPVLSERRPTLCLDGIDLDAKEAFEFGVCVASAEHSCDTHDSFVWRRFVSDRDAIDCGDGGIRLPVGLSNLEVDHTIHVGVRDAAGNTTWHEKRLSLDLTPPPAELIAWKACREDVSEGQDPCTFLSAGSLDFTASDWLAPQLEGLSEEIVGVRIEMGAVATTVTEGLVALCQGPAGCVDGPECVALPPCDLHLDLIRNGNTWRLYRRDGVVFNAESHLQFLLADASRGRTVVYALKVTLYDDACNQRVIPLQHVVNDREPPVLDNAIDVSAVAGGDRGEGAIQSADTNRTLLINLRDPWLGHPPLGVWPPESQQVQVQVNASYACPDAPDAQHCDGAGAQECCPSGYLIRSYSYLEEPVISVSLVPHEHYDQYIGVSLRDKAGNTTAHSCTDGPSTDPQPLCRRPLRIDDRPPSVILPRVANPHCMRGDLLKWQENEDDKFVLCLSGGIDPNGAPRAAAERFVFTFSSEPVEAERVVSRGEEMCYHFPAAAVGRDGRMVDMAVASSDEAGNETRVHMNIMRVANFGAACCQDDVCPGQCHSEVVRVPIPQDSAPPEWLLASAMCPDGEVAATGACSILEHEGSCSGWVVDEFAEERDGWACAAGSNAGNDNSECSGFYGIMILCCPIP